ncbi:MAG: 2-dehydropantoate 2-reductase [Saprospiraceae bacterium]|nr:2-dehydropantoate 2-reductase [Lewinella sp.]
MKIAVIGAGGVGGYFGARLVQSGNEVTFVARNKHLKALKTEGLHIKSILGDFHVRDFQATDDIRTIKDPDLVMLGVKAWQVKEIRDAIRDILHPTSMVLPMQNGIMAAEELTEVIDRSHVLGGLCRIISKIEAPGVINHMGATPSIVFGELDRSFSPRLSTLKGLFDEAGINATASEDIQSDLWKKFIFICVGGLMAMTGKKTGELRSTSEYRKMMIDLLDEIAELATRSGVDLPSDIVSKTAGYIDTLAPDTTFSMARDVWDGRPSEIEYQNGTVVRLAEKLGMEVPVNRAVYESILPLERKARGL